MYNGDSPFLDPHLWQGLDRRADDVIIATYAKFGLLRMQVIVNQLINSATGSENDLLPWVELRHPRADTRIDAINASDDRHILRTHLSASEVYRPLGKYIYVGRDPRDLVFNLYHFLKYADRGWYQHFNRYGFDAQNLDEGFTVFWELWMQGDGIPIWPYFPNLKSWWERRNEANVLFIHFVDFQSNMETELRRIAHFLELDISSNHWPEIVEACTYENISKHSHEERTRNNSFWNGGFNGTKINQKNDGWKYYLNDSHESEIERKLQEYVGVSGKGWLLKQA